MTKAILTNDGRVLIKKPDGTLEAAEDRTDWAHLHAMADADIDLSDAPEATPEMFARATVRQGLKPVEAKSPAGRKPAAPGTKKIMMTFRLAPDVAEALRIRGKESQSTLIELALREYLRNNEE